MPLMVGLPKVGMLESADAVTGAPLPVRLASSARAPSNPAERRNVRPMCPSLLELNAAAEQRAADCIAIAQCEVDGADAGEPVDADHREGDRLPVVRAGAENGHVREGIVERDPHDLVGLEGVAGVGVTLLDGLRDPVLACVRVEVDVGFTAPAVRDIRIAIARMARRWPAVFDP